MGAPEKKWFPGYTATIKLRAPTRLDNHPTCGLPGFDTWSEAHHHMTERAAQQVKDAKRALASAKRHATTVAAMKPPAGVEREEGEHGR